MLDEARNAFGDLIADPDSLDRRARVDVLRRATGAAQAARSRDLQWLGRAVGEWLLGMRSGTLEQALGIAPERGCTLTAPALVERERRDVALLRLSVAVGGDRRALRILRGMEPCPARWGALVQEVGQAPKSVATFTQARRRCSASSR